MLNDSKTEFIIFGTTSKLSSILTTSVRVGDENMKAVEHVQNIGIYFDNELKMTNQVKNMCKNAWLNLYNINKIRNYLTQDQGKTLVHSYITSKLDANNSLLAGVTVEHIKQLQRVQNAAAKLITKREKYNHVTALLFTGCPLKIVLYFRFIV